MRKNHILATMAALVAFTAPAAANLSTDFNGVSGGGSSKAPAYLQCVTYARQATGINLKGDAWTWWDQAEGQYARGTAPRPGAVMAFRPYGKMQLGHVAAVSKVVDTRTVLLNHSNWSQINGRAGQVEENVEAKDVSPANDWSEVQVWYDPIHKLGGTRWPVTGFIYNKKAANSNSKVGNSAKTPEHGLSRTGANADPIGNLMAAYGKAG